ncbi:MAG: hypothetical protein AAGL17_26460, partial [Cyanobacteria bacterium J06576_12]
EPNPEPPAPEPDPEPPAPEPDPEPPAPEPNPEPPASESIFTLALVDSVTDEIVKGYENLSTINKIDLKTLDLTQHTVIAQLNPDSDDANKVKSVKFVSNQGNRIENVKPYALFGDKNGDFSGRAFDSDTYNIEAIAYSKAKGKGEVISSAIASYTVIDETAQASGKQPTSIVDIARA